MDVNPGEIEEIAMTEHYSLSVAATTPESVPEEGLEVQGTLEAEVTATLPPAVFELFGNASTVVSITVSVVATISLFPPKSGGTVSSVIFSLDVGIPVSDLSEPIQMCIPADTVSSYYYRGCILELLHVVAPHC